MTARLRWRVATTEAGLTKGYFVARQLPPPDVANYRDHSVRQPKSNGALARHGYKSVTLVWSVLDPKQSKALRGLIQTALDGTGLLFMTIDRYDGTNEDQDWIDVSGQPHMPEFGSSAVVAGASGRIHDGVEFVLNNLTIVNDPASF